ncbi:24458_t:CDS:2, partial [Cetraspora pellucida]
MFLLLSTSESVSTPKNGTVPQVPLLKNELLEKRDATCPPVTFTSYTLSHLLLIINFLFFFDDFRALLFTAHMDIVAHTMVMSVVQMGVVPIQTVSVVQLAAALRELTAVNMDVVIKRNPIEPHVR